MRSAPATATLRESATPRMGIDTTVSAASRQKVLRPERSLPKTIA